MKSAIYVLPYNYSADCLHSARCVYLALFCERQCIAIVRDPLGAPCRIACGDGVSGHGAYARRCF